MEVTHKISDHCEGLSELLRKAMESQKALVGFQGRGCADGVQRAFCHALLLEVFIFQSP